jgi:hypothetical protein
MEKIWFCYLRFCAFAFIIWGASLHAQTVEPKTVFVEVEVPVENENLAEAKSLAQKQAFEKAVEQLLPLTMEESERQTKIKGALQYIKTYQVIEEKMVGNLLKQRYRVDVLLQTEPVLSPLTDVRATFEIAWMPDEIRFNAAELLRYVQDTMAAPVNSFKVGRGNLTITVTLRKTLEETQSQIAGFVGKRGIVKFLRKEEGAPFVPPAVSEMPPSLPLSSPVLSPPALFPSGAPLEPAASPGGQPMSSPTSPLQGVPVNP